MDCFFVPGLPGSLQIFIWCHRSVLHSPPSRDICVIRNSCFGRGANALCSSTPLDLATPLLRALGAFLRASLSHTGPSCEKLCSSSRSTIEIKTRGELLPGFLLPRCLVWSDSSQQA